MKGSFVLVLLAIVLSAGIAEAAIYAVPPGLTEGQQYRLVFLTSEKRDATSTDIADYNTFVNGVAKSESSLLKSIDTTWTAIASTSAVAAINNTNTPTSTTGIPIYMIDGTKVADDYADLWDGSIDHNINATELDSYLSNCAVWTGTGTSGSQSGSGVMGNSTAVYGGCNQTDVCWIISGSLDNTFSQRFFAMSGVLTAPEPATLSLFGLGGLAMLRRRRKR